MSEIIYKGKAYGIPKGYAVVAGNALAKDGDLFFDTLIDNGGPRLRPLEPEEFQTYDMPIEKASDLVVCLRKVENARDDLFIIVDEENTVAIMDNRGNTICLYE